MSEKPKLIFVCGSRSLTGEEEWVKNVLLQLAPMFSLNNIIHGGAKGIDSLITLDMCKHLEVIRPDYEKYGNKAPLVRNTEMAKKCDMVVAIWDGTSKGTMHAVREVMKLGKTGILVDPKGYKAFGVGMGVGPT